MADDGGSKRAKRESRQRLSKATHYLDPLYESMEVNASFDRYVYMILVSAGLKHVGREGRGHPVFLTLQPSCSLRELDDLMKGVFMSGAGRVSVEYVPVATAKAMNRSTALVVSLGERHTFVSPVIEGELFHPGVHRSAVSGLLVTRYLYESLLDRKLPLTTVRFLKEHHSKVCEDYKAEEDQWRGKLLNIRNNVGTKETVPWHALITCGEAYFRPRLVREVYQGEDNGESGPLDWENGLHKLIQLSIAQCPPQFHLELYRNILIEGEGGQFTGLVDRLRRELTRTLQLTEVVVRICPRYIAWKGAAALSTSLQARTVSREGFSKIRKNANFRKLLHAGAVDHYRPTTRFSHSNASSSSSGANSSFLGGITDLASRSTPAQPPPTTATTASNTTTATNPATAMAPTLHLTTTTTAAASSSTSPTAETATLSSDRPPSSFASLSTSSPSAPRRIPTPSRVATLPEDIDDLSMQHETEEDEEDGKNRFRGLRRASQPKVSRFSSSGVEDLASAPSSSGASSSASPHSPQASSSSSSSSNATSKTSSSQNPPVVVSSSTSPEVRFESDRGESGGLPPPRRVVRGNGPSASSPSGRNGSAKFRRVDRASRPSHLDEEQEDAHFRVVESENTDLADSSRKFKRGKTGTSTSPTNPMREEMMRTEPTPTPTISPGSGFPSQNARHTSPEAALRDEFLTESDDLREMQMPDNLDSIAELQASDLISENILSSHMLERIHRLGQGLDDASSSDETSSSSTIGPLPPHTNNSASSSSGYSASTARKALRSEGSRDFGDLTRSGLFDLTMPSSSSSLAAAKPYNAYASSSSSSASLQVESPPTRRVVSRNRRSISSSSGGTGSKDLDHGRKWHSSLTESDEASSSASTSTAASSSAKLPYRNRSAPADTDSLDPISDLAITKRLDSKGTETSPPAPPRRPRKIVSSEKALEASSSSQPSPSSTASSGTIGKSKNGSRTTSAKRTDSMVDMASATAPIPSAPTGELRRSHSKSETIATATTSSSSSSHSAARLIAPHMDRNKDHIKAKPELPVKPNLNLNCLTTRFHVKIDVHIREYLSFMQGKLTPFVLDQLKDREFLESFVLPRYQKFVHLKQTCEPEISDKLVPDIFIEVAWQAHMTRPLAYRDYSVQHYGGKILVHSLRELVLAHEVEKSDLDVMQKLWKKTFNGESFVKTMPTDKMIHEELASAAASKSKRATKAKGKQDSHNTAPSSSATTSVGFKFPWKRDKTKSLVLPNLDFDLAGAIMEDLECNSTYSKSLRKASNGALSRKNFLQPRSLALLLKAYEMFFYLLLKYGTKYNMAYFKPPPYLLLLWRAHMLAPQFYVRDVKLYHSHLVAQASSESEHDFDKACKTLQSMGFSETPKSPGEFLRFLSEREFGGCLENVVRPCPMLPTEVLVKIFKKLPTRVSAPTLVCKHWTRAANMAEVWISHIALDFPSLAPNVPANPTRIKKYYYDLLHDALGGAVVFDVGAAKVKCGFAGDLAAGENSTGSIGEEEEEEDEDDGEDEDVDEGSDEESVLGVVPKPRTTVRKGTPSSSSSNTTTNKTCNPFFTAGPRYVYQSGIRRAIAKRNRN